MSAIHSTPSEIFGAVLPLAEAPESSAVLFDLDGTLAPIVARPEDARVPERSRELVARIADRYALTGVVSGRRSADARRILGIDEITYIGNHGFELLAPGADRPEPAPVLAGREDEARRFAEALEGSRLSGAGLRIEDKAAIIALHWRGAADEAAAQRAAEEIASEAEAAGLLTHRGRMVIELRPGAEIDKGIGIRALIERHPGLAGAFYAGDDRTDIDGFRALGALLAEGGLDAAVRVAVVSAESPDAVAAAADVVVDGPEGFVAVLEALA